MNGPEWLDIVEKVTGISKHDGISCCAWASDGPCPWSRQFADGSVLADGIQAGLLGPVTSEEFDRLVHEDMADMQRKMRQALSVSWELPDAPQPEAPSC